MNSIITTLKNRTLNERVTIYIALLAAIPNLPVLVIRISQENWLFTFIDCLIILACFFISYSVYIRRQVILMQFALSTIIGAALVVIINYGNANHLFWVFPGVVSFFFLLKPKAALIYSASTTIVIYPIIYGFDNATVMTFYTAVLPTILFSYFCAGELRVQHADLNTMASEDFLTKTGNRRAFQQDVLQSVDAYMRHKIPCCLLLIDMDHFKQLNDNHGHSTGDKVLTVTSHLIKQRLRRSDRLYRIGGEEFAIILNHGTLKEAVSVAQDIKNYVRKFREEDLPECTMSIGLAQLKTGESIDDLMVRADKALYSSKENGRDMITTAH
jgi:diguanylate cyclase